VERRKARGFEGPLTNLDALGRLRTFRKLT